MRAVIFAFLIGCGSETADEPQGSGVEPTLTLGALSAPDVDAVCDYAVGLSRPVTCNGNEVESVTSEEACLDLFEAFAETCDATVADIELCFEVLAAESDDEV
nr:hypothetical protein [Deltaproteobacteria bacterium]